MIPRPDDPMVAARLQEVAERLGAAIPIGACGLCGARAKLLLPYADQHLRHKRVAVCTVCDHALEFPRSRKEAA